ncbi:amino acid ABC transporter ATP-binding protein [Rhizobium leguminosarum]|uniref:amino acid ABC transporter ATP-binding protein n=1 Tax=Rhizobium leguminosarum TaxID=384 RepID=UPI000FEC66BD|nr:amino acid ABC transporter ATP-binding protein [Rhizobium leguminosarum]RWX35221.1 amino acid ABC transporter ATP-binding protein [Rhizobium leguminosarum]
MIVLDRVNKHFGPLHVLKNVSGEFRKGEVTILCGPSGSGKSTLIRTINRLEEINDGTIHVQGRNIHERGLDVDRFRMNLGFVFQQFNLFPHLTVLDNITLAPRKLKKVPRSVAEDQAASLLRRVGLAGKEKAYPEQISGGQAQRVAIARCLAMNPEIMLFDEPTSALDPEMVSEVLSVISQLAAEGMTMVCVTHEMGFAKAVADSIWFLENGQVHGQYQCRDFFEEDNDARIRLFLSHVNRQ